MAINKEYSTPLYQQLVDSVKAQIRDGILKEDDRLGSEQDKNHVCTDNRYPIRQNDRDLPRVQKRRFSSKGGVRAFWEPGFSKPVKKSIKDVKSVTLASSDLPRRETTRGTIAYRKNRKLGKPSTHD